ncbi:MAG: DMT family transporter [Bacteroidota bacterium]
MQQESIQKSILAWSLLIFLGLVWGSSYILMKKGVQVFSGPEVACLRIFSAAILLLPWSLPRLRQLSWRQYGLLFLVGLLESLMPAFLFAQAQTQLDSALNGVLSSVTPVFTLLIGRLWFHRPIVKSELQGTLLGLLGTLFLVLASKSLVGTVNYYVFLPLLACFCYGLNTNLVKYYLHGLDATTIASVFLLLVGIVAGVGLFTQTSFLVKLQVVEGAYTAAGYVLILGALGSAMGQLLFVKLIKNTSPVFANTFAFIIPLVALGWGLLDGEVLVWGQYVGIMTILAGVHSVNKNQA